MDKFFFKLRDSINKNRSDLRNLLLLLLISIIYWNLLPQKLFDDPTSTVVFDRKGELLGARIARDGQWRFPVPDGLPDKYVKCVTSFEDRYFYYHPGFNPGALIRAAGQNLRARKIISGGSTISMQVIRLSRKGEKRTLSEKFKEIILSTRLELQYTKEEILGLYAANAPFGGNIVGLETASWRYFSRGPEDLSWAESAMLAVLPNAPSLMHPGKNRNFLKEKRNRLLFRLLEDHILDTVAYRLALFEGIPEKPGDLPVNSYHLTEYFELHSTGKKIKSTIDFELQEKVSGVLGRHRERLYANQVRNAACLVADAQTGEVLAYYGNIRNPDKPEFGGDNDMIHTPRSTGSILKPFLYAEMQYRGEILPNTLIPDIPTRYSGYSPKNYNRLYDGVVKASSSLARSLNVPSVRMLNDYGIDRFLIDLKDLGFSTLKYSSEHYGLTLILGGAEVTLWDLTRVYTSFSRVLNSYARSDGKYFEMDWSDLQLEINENKNSRIPGEQGRVGAGAVWLCMEAMREVNRPETESGWESFSSSRKIAWKTGTSFGFRDGWAVACTPGYTVAIWTGNADGEGRPGLTGINAAAPVLFDMMNSLPMTGWFQPPLDDLNKMVVCRESGHKAGRFCEDTDTIFVSPAGQNTLACPYHRTVHLDETGSFRVNSECYPVSKMKSVNWFVLPPAQEWFYVKRNSSYRTLPPLMESCKNSEEITQIQLIYPDPGAIIYIPRELSGEKGMVVFEAAHRRPDTRIFWSIDEKYITYTKNFHQISVQPEKGRHILTLVDEEGNKIQSGFEILDR